jgi:transposase
MKEWINRIIKEERRRRDKPLEVKKIGDNYYLYEATTVWLKGKGKRRKLSRYIGKVTECGVIQGRKTKRLARSIYEYGNAQLLINIADELIPPLKEAFGDVYKEIIATSIVRVIQPTPLRLIKTKWEKLSSSKEFTASLSPNSLSERLRLIGNDWEAQKRFFRHLLSKSKYLLFDLSSIISYSEDLRLAEKGYNKDHLYLKQINFALIFSHDHNLPVMIKAMSGSIRVLNL